ncbi:HAMP domain-containing protein [Brevibacillus choshinensis]|uniref:histidine kinase n=2 Tax=Brevibacillus choshinensis TaxID=54911 RepID=A0ABX7FX80_BRECH|nr:ATP-binding protein [Brevibacillus choshinensis]QRG70410.1 HAMP domain-containing protein [Brevibacillus choshinensis]
MMQPSPPPSRSIRFQILVRSLFILSGILLVIGILQYVYMKNFIFTNKALSLQSQILSVPLEEWMSFLKQNRDGAETNPLQALRLPDSSVAIIDQSGVIKRSWADPHHGPAPELSQQAYLEAMQPQKQRGGISYSIVPDAHGFPRLLVLQPIGRPDRPAGLIQLTTSIRALHEVLVRQLTTFVALSILALIGGLLTFLPVLRKTLVPLSTMVQTVESINAGNLNLRLPQRQGQLETDRLAVAFNGMLERLEESFAAEKEAKEQMRRFVADASHELRTPLTSIHGFLEVLLRGAANDPDQLKEALQSMLGESERLTKLIHDLLFLAKIDKAPALAVQLKKMALHPIVRDMEPHLLMLAGTRNVQVEIDTQAELLIDPDRMKQVILNLFQNAVQHTDRNHGSIEVSLRNDASGVLLTVKDNGAGIPSEHLPHLFERFYRIDSARARSQGGSGLGLAITHSIVEAHGGSLSVLSKPGEGSSFTVWLPLAPQKQKKAPF